MSFTLFKQNLIKFKPYEIKAGELIEQYKGVEILHYCNDNKYDFLTNDNIKYEVKAEPMSIKTNNYFIEYMGYGKPSGISTTDADYYIITNTINYYLIDINELKELVIKYGIKRNTKDCSTFGYIIKCNYINDVSIKLN